MKGKHAALVIGIGSPPGAPAGAGSPPEGPSTDHTLRIAADDLIVAVHAHDTARVMDALRAAHMACDTPEYDDDSAKE